MKGALWGAGFWGLLIYVMVQAALGGGTVAWLMIPVMVLSLLVWAAVAAEYRASRREGRGSDE